jgi:hypothetical protein
MRSKDYQIMSLDQRHNLPSPSLTSLQFPNAPLAGAGSRSGHYSLLLIDLRLQVGNYRPMKSCYGNCVTEIDTHLFNTSSSSHNTNNISYQYRRRVHRSPLTQSQAEIVVKVARPMEKPRRRVRRLSERSSFRSFVPRHGSTHSMV